MIILLATTDAYSRVLERFNIEHNLDAKDSEEEIDLNDIDHNPNLVYFLLPKRKKIIRIDREHIIHSLKHSLTISNDIIINV